MRKLYAILIVLFLIFMSGCAGFHNKDLGDISSNFNAQNSSAKPKIYYQVIYDGNMEMRASSKVEKDQEAEFNRAIRISECCIITDESNADIKIKSTINRYENPAALVPAVLTGLSLYIIPSFATYDYTFKAKVSDSKNKEYNYGFKDSWTLFQWLPMMFVFPFSTPMKAEEAVFKSINEHLLYKLKEDKVI